MKKGKKIATSAPNIYYWTERRENSWGDSAGSGKQVGKRIHFQKVGGILIVRVDLDNGSVEYIEEESNNTLFKVEGAEELK